MLNETGLVVLSVVKALVTLGVSTVVVAVQDGCSWVVVLAHMHLAPLKPQAFVDDNGAN